MSDRIQTDVRTYIRTYIEWLYKNGVPWTKQALTRQFYDICIKHMYTASCTIFVAVDVHVCADVS